MARKIKGTEHRVTITAGTEAETKRQLQEWALKRQKKQPKAHRGDVLDHLIPWALARGYPKE